MSEPTTVDDGNMKQVTLSSGGRWYEWNGEHYKSVTTILNEILAKPALIGWTAKATAEYAIDNHTSVTALLEQGERQAAIDLVKKATTRTRDAGGDRGTAVHQAAELIAAGQKVNLNDYLPEHQPYIKAFLKFVEEHDPQWINVETQIGSRVGWYAGTCDLRVSMKGLPVTMDIKTSRVANTIHNQLQLVAYNRAEFCVIDGQEHAWSPTEWGAILQLKPTEGYQLHNVDVGMEAFNTFLAVKEIYDWMKR